jgi:hypothetical protein
MGPKLRRNFSYANVTATIALIAAVGGGTTAIALQGRNSVRTDDIKPGHVTGNDLSQIRVVRRLGTVIDASDQNGEVWSGNFVIAKCPKGTRLISGGGRIDPVGASGKGAITRSEPKGNGWQVTGNQDTGQPATIRASALCLKRRVGPPRLDD